MVAFRFQTGNVADMVEAAISLLLHWADTTWLNVGRYAAIAGGIWFVVWVVLAPMMRRRKIRTEQVTSRQLIAELG